MWNLFRDFSVAMPAVVQDHFKGFFKGTKRQLAAAAQAGEMPIKVGKDPISFPLLRWLAKQMLARAYGPRAAENITSQALMLLSWNLMCRAASTTRSTSSSPTSSGTVTPWWSISGA